MASLANQPVADSVGSISSHARYQHLALFRGVDLFAIAHLLEACHETAHRAGEIVLDRGAQNDCLFQVLSGELEVKIHENSTSPSITLTEGACVGELSILSGVDVSAQVVATTDCELLVIPADIVWSFTNSSHEFATNLLDILAGRVRADNQRLIASIDATEHYKQASRVDALTGLFNRAWFDDVLSRHCQRAQRENTALSAIFIDIDEFKAINDEFGHLIGDQVLRTIAKRVQQGIRSIDTAARYGGEEFALLLYGINLTEAREITERLRREINQLDIHAGDVTINVSFSAGVVQLNRHESPQSFIQAADAAMYRAKNSGRNQVAMRQ